MSNNLVKIIRDDDGNLTDNDTWHLVDPAEPCGPCALCTGEFFGPGESDVEYSIKTVERGGVTCTRCMKMLRIYKAVKL